MEEDFRQATAPATTVFTAVSTAVSVLDAMKTVPLSVSPWLEVRRRPGRFELLVVSRVFHGAFPLELLLSSRIAPEGAACPTQENREERRPNYAQHEDESVSIPSPLPSISFVVARVRDTQTVALAELRALATPELLPPRGLAAPLNREAGRMERRRREPSSASEPT